MVPTFLEMVVEMNENPNILIYRSAQPNEWGVIKDHEFLFKVDELNPHDEFLEFYVRQCSTDK